jgi:CTP synthase
LTTDQIVAKELKDIDGLIVPGGFGSRGVEGMINAIKYARVNKIPYLGICYGMQLATIEFARNVLKMKNANTTENDPNTKFPIFDYIDGRMRLGEQEMILSKNTLAYKLYQNTNVKQRHRHRWEFNNIYKEQFAKYGYIISAVSNDQEKTAEIIELKNHPYFIGCQFHPEFSSWPNKNDPAFLGLIKAAMKK